MQPGSTGLPIGLYKEAVLFAEETHRISPYDPRLGEFKKVSVITVKQKLQEFMGNQTVIFSLNDKINKYEDIDACLNTFEKIFEMKEIAAAPLHQLLYSLQKRSGQKISEKFSGREILLKNIWENYSIGCRHHFRQDAPKYCTLARVKRWAFHICNLILSQDEMRVNSHFPCDTLQKEPTNEIQMLMVWKEEEEEKPEIKVEENNESFECWFKNMTCEIENSMRELSLFSSPSTSHSVDKETVEPSEHDEYIDPDFESILLSEYDNYFPSSTGSSLEEMIDSILSESSNETIKPN